MPRIIGTDIPGNKRLVISLTYIFGIGNTLAVKVIEELSLNPDMKASELTEDQIAKIGTHLQENYVVEGDLRREVSNNIKRLISINSYRGQRHRVGLPVRGQKTATNARTRKGKKKTVAGKKKAV
ncbi:MAG: 30S ribosomal protein S13 [Chlamydiales bacterium]|nr:30S ribosomal protein S13 [Chlamydiales bacterium]NCF71384.1 30S ribosomal protein S13 [Chlamydiales bacterium]